MTEKRFVIPDGGLDTDVTLIDTLTGKEYEDNFNDIVDLMNDLHEKNEQLRNRIKDWHQRTFQAHEYFNLLEKVIDEVCNDDISNEIWKEYEKREKVIE